MRITGWRSVFVNAPTRKAARRAATRAHSLGGFELRISPCPAELIPHLTEEVIQAD